MENGINNMFNSRHYVPILKWKRAEQGALKELEEKHKKYITPLIQFVMPKYQPQDKLESVVAKFEKQLPEIPGRIVEIWGKAPIFIDSSLLFTTQLKAKSLNTISRDGHRFGAVLIPIIHINDELHLKKSVWSVARKTKSGLCVRLICSDFSDMPRLGDKIAELLSSSGLAERDIDLLIDIKEIEETDGKFAKYIKLSQDIPNLLKWRTVTFASGSFPEDLSRCKLDEENLIPRVGWKNWKEQVSGNALKRKPTFADYTIQYPIYKESLQFYHPTTSIKYTLENEWWALKGRKHKFDIYLANANLLAKDTRFYGSNFSSGDKYISDKARHFNVYIKNKSIGGTGSTETWLRAGINHHLALVAHQVATLT
ncbi:MAG: beta family protein [Proteobacteria bacterium]|nr:beta family protein [Pseudomonadota bacterium]